MHCIRHKIGKIEHITFKMPRVVPDQRSKFENEEFFRKLSRECEVNFIPLIHVVKVAETKLTLLPRKEVHEGEPRRIFHPLVTNLS